MQKDIAPKSCIQFLGLPRSPAILKRLRGLDPGNSLNSSGQA